MDYREFDPPNEIAHLAAAAWTLDVGNAEAGWTAHTATPDGCVEIIHRLEGCSIWRTDQPAAFVAGLITGPAQLQLSSGSRFIGLRLRPWAWNALSGTPVRDFVDNWRDLTAVAPHLCPFQSAEEALDLIPADLLTPDEAALANAIVDSASVAELVERSGRPRRWLQRWFQRNVGLPPQTYLRLVRFNETFAGMDEMTGTLADHAAAHGFADQAHMAREFRKMSGEPAVTARKRARGPFLAPNA